MASGELEIRDAAGDTNSVFFGFDDSEVTIKDRPHTILAGFGVNDESVVTTALNKIKQQFGLSPTDEVKWNGMNLDRSSREALSQELLILLHEGVPLVTIVEGRDQQNAAEHAAKQVADYLDCHSYQVERSPGLFLRFDEGIISNPKSYGEFLEANPSIELSSASFDRVDSKRYSLVQLADVLAGFNRLLTESCLGRRPKTEVEITEMSDSVKMPLDHYISVSQRWSMWGEVPPPPDPDNITFDGRWPFKHVGGYGLRIISSISRETIAQIYSSRIVYMGCMH